AIRATGRIKPYAGRSVKYFSRQKARLLSFSSLCRENRQITLRCVFFGTKPRRLKSMHHLWMKPALNNSASNNKNHNNYIITKTQKCFLELSSS
ncbi:hypothetical protein, partial [Winslowiella toletana]|uniref:hypothetical protein n=1 Tax=Winslowiella toletana TaxID=92490 RepID=UPI0019D7016C